MKGDYVDQNDCGPKEAEEGVMTLRLSVPAFLCA